MEVALGVLFHEDKKAYGNHRSFFVKTVKV
jgi:hypothetical protein